MPLQIANPTVVEKVDRLARLTGLSKTAAVEQAVEQRLRELSGASSQPDRDARRLKNLLIQFDHVPLRQDHNDPLDWDEHGLPR